MSTTILLNDNFDMLFDKNSYLFGILDNKTPEEVQELNKKITQTEKINGLKKIEQEIKVQTSSLGSLQSFENEIGINYKLFDITQDDYTSYINYIIQSIRLSVANIRNIYATQVTKVENIVKIYFTVETVYGLLEINIDT